jgi:hypothetical protein
MITSNVRVESDTWFAIGDINNINYIEVNRNTNAYIAFTENQTPPDANMFGHVLNFEKVLGGTQAWVRCFDNVKSYTVVLTEDTDA